MVRGNFQKRLEMAAKRKKAKERKQHQSDQKKHFKTFFQNTLSLLDRHDHALQRRIAKASSSWEIHLWTDILPSTSPPVQDLVVEDELLSGKHKQRRGPRVVKTYKGNKASKHPRSKDFIKEAEAVAEAEAAEDASALCKRQFFFGKCLDPPKGGVKHKKGAGCRCCHLIKRVPTVFSVLSLHCSTDSATLMESLTECEKALPVEEEDSDPNGMDMVYHVGIPLATVETTSTNETTSASSINEQITSSLTNNSCGVANVVYMAIATPNGATLLYDRNRDGLLVSDSSFSATVLGLKTESSDDHTASAALLAQQLPAAVLENILLFLPDGAVAVANQVCRGWAEAGKTSPNLWRCLHERRGWLLPLNFQAKEATRPEMDALSSTQAIRAQFVQHYTVARDLRAIQLALQGLLTKKPTEEKEMTYQSYASRRGAPQSPNRCVGVRVWGPNRILAAYSNDCTLRLFQGVAREGLAEKFCRELICESIDPFKHTKRKSCYMLDFDLDDEVVGALCSVSDETDEYRTQNILVVVSRDNLLQGHTSTIDSSGRPTEETGGFLRVFEIEKEIVNFLLANLEEADEQHLRLLDFLDVGGNQEDLELIVSQSMCSLGYGMFALEVAISIPVDEGNIEEAADDIETHMVLLLRKVFIFSSALGSFVWMDNSTPSDARMRPTEEDMTMTALRRPLPGSQTMCTVAIASHAYAPSLVTLDIDPSGVIKGTQEIPRGARFMEDGWSVQIDGRRSMAISSTDYMIGDTVTRPLENQRDVVSQVHITFYSRSFEVNENLHHYRVTLAENCSLDSMVCLRDQYLVLNCRFYGETGYAVDDGGGGHWGNASNQKARVYCVTYHIPTRSEVARQYLYEDFGKNKVSLSASDQDTVAVGVWHKGLIMTGNDIRSLSFSSSEHNAHTKLEDPNTASRSSSKKKGKKRISKGNNKKDGFARGMSLRG